MPADFEFAESGLGIARLRPRDVAEPLARGTVRRERILVLTGYRLRAT